MPDRPSSRPRGDLLLERVDERRALADAVRASRQGEGRIVVIEGMAGIGKTALLEALVADLDPETTAATARGSELEGDFAFGLVLQLLAPLVESAGSPASFEGAAALARPLFDRAAIDTGRDAVFPLLHGLHWLCASLAERNPLVLCVDDAQSADEQSLRFLAYLGSRVAELPILLAIARRTGEGEEPEPLRELAGLQATRALRPAELSGDAVDRLAREALGEAVDEELSREILRRSGGNPLFVHELLRSAEEAGRGGLDDVPPESVVHLVERRERRLPAEAQAAARALAILGDSATLAELEAVGELSTEEALSALDQLHAAELTDPAVRHRFRHPILRESVMESIPAGERALLRMRAARAVAPRDASRAAAHLVAGWPDGPSGAPWAAGLLREAADAARRRGGGQEAIAYLRRALEEPIGTGERRATLLELGRLEAHAAESDALEHLAEAAALAPDSVERARIELVRGDALFHLIALEECSRVCREAIDGLGETDRELRLSLEATALNADALRGVDRDRPATLADEVAAAATAGERAVLVHVVADMAATGRVPAARVRELGARALAGGRLLDEVGPASPLFIYAGTAMAWAGDHETVLELTTDGLERGRRSGSLIATSYSAALRSGAALRAGDLALAESDSELVVAGLPGGDPMAFAVAHAWLIEIWIERGRVEDARAALERSGLTGVLPELGTIAFLMLARGSLAAAEGDHGGALSEFEEVGRRVRTGGYGNPAAMDWRSRSALMLARLGERQRAVELAEEEVELARAFGAPRATGKALRARGSIMGGRAGQRDLREAVDLLEGVSPVEHARAVVELGRALHSAGEGSARETLYEGMDLAHRAGAHALVQEAMEALREAGARPRRPRVTGADSLTPQERRIAQLAAEGRSNRQIAEALFLTRRTVEMHLSNAYRKLRIDSRDELPDSLRSAPSSDTKG